MAQNPIQLISTYYSDYPTYKDYIEYFRDMQSYGEKEDEEPAEEDSQEFMDWQNEEVDLWVDDFFANLKYSDYEGEPVKVTGTLGLWDGSHEIEPKRFGDITKAIKACIGSCDYFKVETCNGRVLVTASHHDGTNCFSIHRANGRFFKKWLY